MPVENEILIRNADPSEHTAIGELLVDVYAQLDGFPKQNEQPDYYRMLRQVGDLTRQPGTEIIIASRNNQLLGAVVNFSDMQYYGAGGTATSEKNAGGFRLLAVHASARGLGVGKKLTMECIARARDRNLKQVIIHSTKAMTTAWKMYENIGFERSPDLDFMQAELPVFGFRLKL